jgi:uncharacterized protein
VKPVLPSFADVQARLTAHLRDPANAPAPDDVDPARVAVYARLLFNNIHSLLSSCFPVLRAVTADEDWRRLLREFYATHRSRTPLFPRLPREFAIYLTEERGHTDDPPWQAELADYEWLELECAQDPRELSDVPLDPAADLLDDVPVLNPLARARAYAYPVHTIAPDALPAGPGAEPTYLVVFRDRDDKVGYLKLNAVSARLVELLATDAAHSGRELLMRIAAELSHPRPARLVEAGRALLEDLCSRGLLLGATRRASPPGDQGAAGGAA